MKCPKSESGEHKFGWMGYDFFDKEGGGLTTDRDPYCVYCGIVQDKQKENNMEKHVTSLELSKRLKALGVKQESQFYWVLVNPQFDQWVCVDKEKAKSFINDHKISAFLASELGEMLPPYIQFEKESLPFSFRITKEIGGDFPDEYAVYYCRYSKTLHSEKDYQERGRSTDESLSNALALMLEYLIQNKMIGGI